MSELFNVPEQPSPRLAWIKKHQIRTARNDFVIKYVAWLPNNDYEPLEGEELTDPRFPNNEKLCGYGDTIDDAIFHLAKRNNTKLWNEEQL